MPLSLDTVGSVPGLDGNPGTSDAVKPIAKPQ
jgi:hypothetical protein